MSSKAKNRRKRLGRKKCITLADGPPIGYNGDHGTGAPAMMQDTRLVPISSDPNRRAYRQRVDVWQKLDLEMAQQQAARAIRDAYCRVEALSSGSPLKERVQTFPKPDQTIAHQVDAQSHLIYVMQAVPRSDRHVVEHVLRDNRPLRALSTPRAGHRLRYALDQVAAHLGFTAR